MEIGIPGQDFSLELINGVVTINTFFFLLWCSVHIHSEFNRRELTWYFALVGLPSVAIVVAMFSEKIGTMMTRSVTWVWRMHGGTVPFNDVEDALLFGGALFTALGLLWSVAILSRPRFGEWPWRIAAGVTLCYVFVSSLLHYLF